MEEIKWTNFSVRNNANFACSFVMIKINYATDPKKQNQGKPL